MVRFAPHQRAACCSQHKRNKPTRINSYFVLYCVTCICLLLPHSGAANGKVSETGNGVANARHTKAKLLHIATKLLA